jgi:hypothetical protein
MSYLELSWKTSSDIPEHWDEDKISTALVTVDNADNLLDIIQGVSEAANKLIHQLTITAKACGVQATIACVGIVDEETKTENQ